MYRHARTEDLTAVVLAIRSNPDPPLARLRGSPRYPRRPDPRPRPPGPPPPLHRLRGRRRRAPRLARRGRVGAANALRWGARHVGAWGPLCVRRPRPAASTGPATAPAADRRRRREEDPPDGRALRRHVERRWFG